MLWIETERTIGPHLAISVAPNPHFSTFEDRADFLANLAGPTLVLGPVYESTSVRAQNFSAGLLSLFLCFFFCLSSSVPLNLELVDPAA